MSEKKKEASEKLSDGAAEEFRKKMQGSMHKILKDLGVKALGFEAPQGTNGALSSGSLIVDLITGGGFPKHRMTTISGESGAGKTTLMSKAEGLALARGLICHHLDLEGAADYTWMLRGGTDMNQYLGKRGVPKTLYYVPDFESGDSSFRYMSRTLDDAMAAGSALLPDLGLAFFQDSIPACVPESLLENDEKGSSPDLAIMLSRFIPMVRMKLKKANAAYVTINQIRENPRAQFSSPFYEPGGAAPTYYADLKLELNKRSKPKNLADTKKDHGIVNTDQIKAGGVHIETNLDGTEDRYRYTHVKVSKNRVFPPFKEAFIRIWTEEQGGTGRGIDPVWDVIHFFEMVGQAEFLSRDDVTLKGKPYEYLDLKKEILARPDLLLEAQEMIRTGKAFEQYFRRLAGGDVEIGKPDETPEDLGKDAK